MYLEKETEKLRWSPYLVWTEALKQSYAYEVHHCLLMQTWFTNSGTVRTQIISSISAKVVLTIPVLELLVVTRIIFDRNTEEEKI